MPRKFASVPNNVPNIKYTTQLGGALSGLAPSVLVKSGAVSTECAIIAFSVYSNGEGRLRAELNAFGHCPGLSEEVFNEHMLSLYAILADDTRWTKTIDVTDLMHDPSSVIDERHIRIIIDEEINIPKPIVNGSGFHPEVDEWESVFIEVKM